MELIILVVGLPPLCWLAYRRPLLATVVLSFVAYSGDSIGIPVFIERHGGRMFALLTRLPVLIATFVAWFHLRRRIAENRLPRYLLWFANMALAGAGWFTLGTLSKGGAILAVFAAGVDSGLLFIVVGLAYASDAGTRRILAITVTLHILLALLISLAPGSFLGEFGGWHYYSLRDSEAFADEAVSGAWELDRGQCAQGHFCNSHGFAIYSAFGVAIGSYLLAAGSRCSSALAGLLMCPIGAAGLLLAMGRCEMLGLLLGSFWGVSLHMFNKGKAIDSAGFVRLTLLLLALSAAALVIVPGHTDLLHSAFVGDMGEAIAIRQNVLKLGVRASLEYPLFGVPHDYEWPGYHVNIYPHVLPLYYSALFGLPVGAIGFVLLSALFWGPSLTRRYWNDRCEPKLVLGGMFAGIVLAVACANNCPTPILLWWSWALVVVPYEDVGQDRLVEGVQRRRWNYAAAQRDS